VGVGGGGGGGGGCLLKDQNETTIHTIQMSFVCFFDLFLNTFIESYNLSFSPEA